MPPQYLGEGSAAFTFSIVAFGATTIVLMIWIAVITLYRSDIPFTLTSLLSLASGVIALIGGIIAKREWEE